MYIRLCHAWHSSSLLQNMSLSQFLPKKSCLQTFCSSTLPNDVSECSKRPAFLDSRNKAWRALDRLAILLAMRIKTERAADQSALNSQQGSSLQSQTIVDCCWNLANQLRLVVYLTIIYRAYRIAVGFTARVMKHYQPKVRKENGISSDRLYKLQYESHTIIQANIYKKLNFEKTNVLVKEPNLSRRVFPVFFVWFVVILESSAACPDVMFIREVSQHGGLKIHGSFRYNLATTSISL